MRKVKLIDFIDKFNGTEKIILDIPLLDRTEAISIEISEQAFAKVRSALKMNFRDHIVESFFIEDGALRINLDMEDNFIWHDYE